MIDPLFTRKVLERALILARLQNNWDHNGALPVDDEALIMLFQILMKNEGTPAPSIYPTKIGGVIAEWVLVGQKVKMEFLPYRNIGMVKIAYYKGFMNSVVESWSDTVLVSSETIDKVMQNLSRKN